MLIKVYKALHSIKYSQVVHGLKADGIYKYFIDAVDLEIIGTS